MSLKADLFIDCRCDLGEGPFWHPDRAELFWFNINAGDLYRANPKGEVLDRWRFDEPVSAAALIDHDTLLVAAASGVMRFSILSGEREMIAPLEDDMPATRSNDSRVSPQGTWWVGTMSRSEDATSGKLYGFRDGVFSIIKSPVHIPNAICFAPDGTRAYFADTPSRKIMKVDLDPQTGMPAGDWSLFVDLAGQPGAPDGAVTDAEGFVWNAEYGGGRVVRYSPDGEVDNIVEVPCANVTCPVLGGPDLKTLYITTAAQGMTDDEKEAAPLAGGIFECEVDVPGVPEVRVRYDS